jgi:MerR family transcriptional regulator, redox-sensitive transcriptional activator SoxR
MGAACQVDDGSVTLQVHFKSSARMTRSPGNRPQSADSGLSIGEVARRSGLRPSTLRYYESVGLLPPPRRVNGRRQFDADVVRLLGTVRFAQEAGFTVAEIRTLFHGFGADVPPAARWQQLAKSKLAELDALVARAERMRRALSTAMRCGCLRIEDCESDSVDGCTRPGPASLGRARSRRSANP